MRGVWLAIGLGGVLAGAALALVDDQLEVPVIDHERIAAAEGRFPPTGRNLTPAERRADAENEEEYRNALPPGLSPFDDQGAADQIEEVKRAARSLLSEYYAVQEGRRPGPDFLERHRRIYRRSIAGREAAELARQMRLDASLPDSEHLVLTRLAERIDTFNGVAIDGSRAVVLASGEVTSESESGVSRVAPHEWQIHLIREDGRWKLDFVYERNLAPP